MADARGCAAETNSVAEQAYFSENGEKKSHVQENHWTPGLFLVPGQVIKA